MESTWGLPDALHKFGRSNSQTEQAKAWEWGAMPACRRLTLRHLRLVCGTSMRFVGSLREPRTHCRLTKQALSHHCNREALARGFRYPLRFIHVVFGFVRFPRIADMDS